MTDREIEQRLKTAVENLTPDVLDSIMSDCQTASPQTQIVQMPKKDRNMLRRFVPLAAAFALVVGIASFSHGRLSGREPVAPGTSTAPSEVFSLVSLDVNPSVELALDSSEIVLRASSINSDGADVLDGLTLEGTHVDTAISAVIGSLLQHGYIDELANSILVTVECSDSARAEQLEQQLAGDIGASLSQASVNASILSQYVSDPELDSLSSQYVISHGKAALISQIQDSNPALTVDELAGLTINELNLLLSNPKNAAPSVTSTGSASDIAYIGADRAIEIALGDAGLGSSDIYDLDAEYDCSGGRLVYDVDFSHGYDEYDYDIDAVSGDIVDRSIESDAPGESVYTEIPSGSGDIGSEKAKAIALEHTGAAESAVSRLKVDRSRDDGILEYEVEFVYSGMEYEYTIDAASGRILEYDLDEADDGYQPEAPVSTPAPDVSAAPESTPAPAGDIGSEAAKAAAFAHAGVSAADVHDLKVEFEHDDGITQYKIEFKAGGVEYEYDIDAASGAVLDFEADRDD